MAAANSNTLVLSERVTKILRTQNWPVRVEPGSKPGFQRFIGLSWFESHPYFSNAPEIPIFLESVETLQFLGFKESSARSLCATFRRYDDDKYLDGPVFLLHVTDCVERRYNSLRGNWRNQLVVERPDLLELLHGIGFTANDAIAVLSEIGNWKPGDIVSLENAKFWANEFLGRRYTALARLDSDLLRLLVS